MKEESRLNSILILNECAERLTLEVSFRYRFCQLVIVPSFSKVLFQCLLKKNGSIVEFYSFLVVGWSVTGLWL